jgi:hypothetical protein
MNAYILASLFLVVSVQDSGDRNLVHLAIRNAVPLVLRTAEQLSTWSVAVPMGEYLIRL